MGINNYWIAAVVVMLIGMSAQYFRSRKKQVYLPAVARFEGGGIKRGLTPPEAAALLGKPIQTILGLVIVGLLRKGFLHPQSGEDFVFQVAPEMRSRERSMNPGKREELRRAGAQEMGQVLYPNEELFLELFEQEGSRRIDQMDFSILLKPFIHSIAGRVAGYAMEETRAYYRLIIQRASKEARADGVLVADHQKVFERNISWILLHDDRSMHLGGDGGAFSPNWFFGETGSFLSWVETLEEFLRLLQEDQALRIKLGNEIDEVSAVLMADIAQATYYG